MSTRDTTKFPSEQRYEMARQEHEEQYRTRLGRPSSFSMWCTMLPVMLIVLLGSVVSATEVQLKSNSGVVGNDPQGDLDGLNALLKNVEISFPNYENIDAGKILLAHLFVNVERLKCHNLHVSNIQLMYPNADELQFRMDEFNIDCNFGWHYRYLIKHGSGDGSVESRGNTVSSALRFTKNNTNTKDQFARYNVTKDYCDASVSIDALHFEGGFADMEGEVVSLFKSVVQKKIQSAVQGIVCQQLQKNLVFQQILQSYEQKAFHYITLPHRDVLEPEHKLSTSIKNSLIDLQQLPDYPMGYWIQNAVDKVRDYVTRPTHNNSDLTINHLLRTYILTKDGNDDGYYLTIPVSKMAPGFIYSGKDLFNTMITIKLDNITLYGLDSITNMEPLLQPVGHFTVASSVTLKNLTSRMDFTVHFTPPNNTEQVENISITWGVEKVNLTSHALIGVLKDKWSDLTLSHFLHEEHLLGCLSTVFHSSSTQIAGLKLQISDQHMTEPKLTGLVSKSIDQLLTNMTHFALDLYKSDTELALPNFFDSYIRTILNKLLSNKVKSLHCPISSRDNNYYYSTTERQLTSAITDNNDDNRFVNFYDLLLNKEEAKKMGGTGLAPYGDVISQIKSLLQTALSLPSNYSLSAVRLINDLLVGPVTRNQSNVTGELLYPGNLFHQNFSLHIAGLNSTVQVSLSDMTIEHLNTVGQPIKIISPTGPFDVTSQTTFGVSPNNSNKQHLTAKITLYVKIWGQDKSQALEDKLNISLKVSDLSMLVSTLLKVSTKRFENLPLKDFLNAYCWASLIPAPKLDEHGLVKNPSKDYPTAAISGLALTLSSLQLDVDCIICTSKGFKDLSHKLKTPEGQKKLFTSITIFLHHMMTMMEGKISQVFVDRALNEAERKCSNPKSPDPKFLAFDVSVHDPYPQVLISIIGFTLLLFLSSLLFKGFLVNRARNRIHHRVKNAPNEEISRRLQREHREKTYQTNLNNSTRPMFLASPVPLVLRICVPFIIIGNIILFLTGHLSLGASVAIHAGMAGQSTVINHFYEFSMFHSAIQMWTSGAKILSVLTVAFSGIWPYSKQLITLFLWFAPPSIVSVKRRGAIFDWLDLYSKWSLVDIFVTMMSIIGFRTTINSPTDLSFLPHNFYYLHLLVIPRWGIYANMIAILVSQVTSHFLVYYHRKVVSSVPSINHRNEGEFNEPEKDFNLSNSDCRPLEAEIDTIMLISPSNDSNLLLPRRYNDRVEVLSQHVFVYDGNTRLQKFKLHNGANIFVTIFATLVFFFHVVGCILPIFDLETVGLVGVAVDIGNNLKREVTQYSVVSMIRALFGQVLFLKTLKSFLGMTSLILILITAIVTLPLLLYLLLKRWFRPLSEKERTRLDFTIEMLHAWQLVEVFLFSIMVAAWQLGPVSQFFLNAYCGSLTNTLHSLAFFGFLQDKDAQCLRIQGTLNNYTWFLFFASVTFAVFNHIVTAAAKQQVNDHVFVVSNGQDNFTEDGDSFADDVFVDENLIVEYREKAERSINASSLNFVDWYRYILCLEEVSETTYELIDQDECGYYPE